MFWIISAILILIAMAFLLPPMLQKQRADDAIRRQQNILITNEQLAELEKRFEQGEIDQNDYQNSRDELELTLFSNVNDDDTQIESEATLGKAPLFSIVAVALLVPLLSILLYMKLGTPAFTTSFDSKKVAAELSKRPEVPRKADGTPDIDAMVAGLQKKMEQNPDNAKGWFMLGRSYMVLKRYEDAAKSYEKSLKLKPDSADIMLSLADALAMTNQGNIEGRPVALINKALEIEPNNLTALWLGGMAARQKGDNLLAIKRWQKVKSMIQDPTEKTEVSSLIAETMKKLSPEQKKALGKFVNKPDNTAQTSKTSQTDNSAAATAQQGIKVSVSLADKFKNKVKPDDLVFVYAKAMSGPPMPLAAAKVQVKDLPVEITLNDAMAMMPTMKISSFPEVIVGARVSKSGRPISQNGDLYTEKKSVKLGDSTKIVINSIVKK